MRKSIQCNEIEQESSDLATETALEGIGEGALFFSFLFFLGASYSFFPDFFLREHSLCGYLCRQSSTWGWSLLGLSILENIKKKNFHHGDRYMYGLWSTLPDGFSPHSPIAKRALFLPSRENSPLLALFDLEFRKAFLILNYTGRRRLEEHMKVDDIMMLKDLPMRDFETKVWDAVGKDFINKDDRIQVEAAGVGKVRHKRLVNLIGCCAEGDEHLLVAEYMPHDTLSEHLFHCWELVQMAYGSIWHSAFRIMTQLKMRLIMITTVK